MLAPFTFTCEKSIEVFEQTKNHLQSHEYAKEIEQLGWTYRSIGEVIPHTSESLWSGHFFPWAESWDELQISTSQCFFGLYKQAMVSLRSGLELGLLSVYWNLHDDGHVTIRNWLKSQQNTPRLPDIWKRLEKHDNFRAFQTKHNIKQRILNLGHLHDYVHSKGFKYSNRLGLMKPNTQTFEEQGLKIWFENFREVVEVLSILHLVKYPIGTIKYDFDAKFGIDKPMFGGLEPFQVERLEEILGETIISAIREIAEKDPNVKNILEWINGLPDLTENEIEEQILEWDKSMIKHQGLESWLEYENTISQHRKTSVGDDFSESESHRRKVETLTQWAKENGYEKPITERNPSVSKQSIKSTSDSST